MKLFLLCIFGFSLAKCHENRYGLKGKSIRLSISPGNQSEVVWRRFDRKVLLAYLEDVSPIFSRKISLNLSDWSLTIHNLQENDTGLYEAVTKWQDTTLAEFKLTVENTLSEPEIEVSAHDVNSSAGVCRAAVNCSIDGSWASYDCDQSVCVRTQASQSSIDISVTVQDRSLWCRVNNHVSKNHSQAPNIKCHEKLQSDLPSPPDLISWIAVTAGVVVALGLLMGLIVVVVKKRNTSKVHPQSSHAVTGRDMNTVIEQHHETVYSTVEKPGASQNPPGNNTEATIYDTPSRHPRVCQINSVTLMTENQEQQRSGHDRTVKVRATVHKAEEPDSEQINTVYCKLGEI
ncbi:uncharacterized protein si:ch1073-220m6.1 [Rhinichthys klamathensis goyatoka]|uniref:uncharacterized protein si:ch1073-220m6.1 n=1 Tax=Rhinichthys klamathensis goyatoka TaxID=3034132 RepID=UPI0024B60303|nr:uncharacterized protein si:ch1073-220m6.1 [Rhinichthys klamathensis goyatoka]